MQRAFVAAVIVAAGLVIGAKMTLPAADEPAPLSVPAATSPEPLSQPRPIPTRTYMHAKLTSTQNVLAGLLAEDFPLISRSARELEELAHDVPARAGTEGIQDAVYEHFRLELQRQAAELQRMSAAQQLNGAAYVHGSITSTCLGCHRHLRGQPGAIELLSQPLESTAR